MHAMNDQGCCLQIFRMCWGAQTGRLLRLVPPASFVSALVAFFGGDKFYTQRVLQSLSPDATFVREKSRSSQRLNEHKHKDGKGSKGVDKVDHKIPVTEALFLPHFPLRGEIEDHDFEVKICCFSLTNSEFFFFFLISQRSAEVHKFQPTCPVINITSLTFFPIIL